MDSFSLPFLVTILAMADIGLFADRAAVMQALLATLASVLCAVAAVTSPSPAPRYLTASAGVLMAFIIVFTLRRVFPINDQLKVDKDLERARRNLMVWEQLHLYRTLLSLAALASAASALWQLASP
ncbi:hypothetical protein GPECTOR_19g259 [Gonium pectorale]|uniref:DUF1772 domain-containing protein n=1 Tax=Gonium pectorale TaxID=33097 RepID=A0A150GJ33_GONPE|nr:hypothetical protein GPECTOR_19g259 [Gonium pectorale]|eukprot:KXZ49808.1 hypothetical protein GPECTOR_19g259 [Gonium pectorale]